MVKIYELAYRFLDKSYAEELKAKVDKKGWAIAEIIRELEV